MEHWQVDLRPNVNVNVAARAWASLALPGGLAADDVARSAR